MGLDPVTIGLIISATAATAGAIQTKREADKQAIAAKIDAGERSDVRSDEVRKQLARNTTLFAKSGVTLEGSPLFALETDTATGVKDVQSILRGGQAQASSLRGQGRSALFSGLGSAAGTASRIDFSSKAPTTPKKK